MRLENPLQGYEPSANPADVTASHAELLVALLRDNGYMPCGSCVTREPGDVAGMIKELRAHSPSAITGKELIGPLMLGDILHIGNAIGLWKQK
jgi:hypothetical protein